jgi:hypothetical protein
MAAGTLLADRTCKARRPGICGKCGGPVRVGARIALVTEDGRPRWLHIACAIALSRAGGGRPVETLPPL